MLNYFFHPKADKELSHLPIKEQEHIIAKVKEVCQLNHPLQHRKVIKLRGKRCEQFRLRVGNYRVKFFLADRNTIKITHVQHRQIGY